LHNLVGTKLFDFEVANENMATYFEEACLSEDILK